MAERATERRRPEASPSATAAGAPLARAVGVAAGPPTRPRSSLRANGGRSEGAFARCLRPGRGAQTRRPRLARGTLRAPTKTTLSEAADDRLSAARAGIARTRSGDPYKPSALRSYEEALLTKVLPELGHLRLSAVDRVASRT
jgi:hypothetical protein